MSAGRGILRWIRSFGSFGILVGIVGTLTSIADQEWGLAVIGVIFALLSYGWFILFDILGGQHEK